MRHSPILAVVLAAVVLAAVGCAAAGSASAATPPIACHPARTTVDRAICASPEYRAMDREIAALYDHGLALADPPTRRLMLQRRRLFLKEREGCQWAAHDSAHPGTAVDECIRAAMETRVAALRRFVDRGAH